MNERPKGIQGEWVAIPLHGRVVSRCYVDSAFGIQFFDEPSGFQATLRVESEFKLKDSSGERTLSTDDLVLLGHALQILRKTVVSGRASKVGGALRLAFTDGSELEVIPDDLQFESWEYTDSKGNSVICMPGGTLAEVRGQ